MPSELINKAKLLLPMRLPGTTQRQMDSGLSWAAADIDQERQPAAWSINKKVSPVIACHHQLLPGPYKLTKLFTEDMSRSRHVVKLSRGRFIRLEMPSDLLNADKEV